MQLFEIIRLFREKISFLFFFCLVEKCLESAFQETDTKYRHRSKVLTEIKFWHYEIHTEGSIYRHYHYLLLFILIPLSMIQIKRLMYASLWYLGITIISQSDKMWIFSRSKAKQWAILNNVRPSLADLLSKLAWAPGNYFSHFHRFALEESRAAVDALLLNVISHTVHSSVKKTQVHQQNKRFD